MNKEDFRRAVLGLTLEEANKIDSTYKIRTSSIDGSQFLLTCDYVENRLNVGLRDGKIYIVKDFG